MTKRILLLTMSLALVGLIAILFNAMRPRLNWAGYVCIRFDSSQVRTNPAVGQVVHPSFTAPAQSAAGDTPKLFRQRGFVAAVATQARTAPTDFAFVGAEADGVTEQLVVNLVGSNREVTERVALAVGQLLSVRLTASLTNASAYAGNFGVYPLPPLWQRILRRINGW